MQKLNTASVFFLETRKTSAFLNIEKRAPQCTNREGPFKGVSNLISHLRHTSAPQQKRAKMQSTCMWAFSRSGINRFGLEPIIGPITGKSLA